MVLRPPQQQLAPALTGGSEALDFTGAVEVVERLLERTFVEFADADDPVARLAADRCVRNLAACAEQLSSAGRSGPPERTALLHGAWIAALAARGDLELIGRRGAILPPSLRALAAGVEVLLRRIGAAPRPVQPRT